MIQAVVDTINSSLKALDAVCYGVSTPTVTDDGEGKISIIPIEINHIGDCRYPDPEDNNKLTFYHRLVRKSYAKAKGYGDGNGLLVTYEMKLLCFGMRRKAKTSAEEIEQQVVALLPEKVGKAKVEIIASDFDQNRLFSEEFVNVENFINPEMFLFATTYRISISYNTQRCIN